MLRMEPAKRPCLTEIVPYPNPPVTQTTNVNNFIYMPNYNTQDAWNHQQQLYYQSMQSMMSQYAPPSYYGNPMSLLPFSSYPMETKFFPEHPIVQHPMITPQLPMGSTMMTPDSDDVTRRSPNPSEQIGFEVTPTGRPLTTPQGGGTNDRKRKISDISDEKKNEDDDQEKEENNENALPVLGNMLQGAMESRVVEDKPEVFCRVAGRLTVVGNPKSYDVCVDEVCRRVLAPESLNKSTLGPLLRRGKIKGCGDELIELVKRRGLLLSKQLKKKSFSNCFTAFLEGESLKFSEDHENLMEKHIPIISIARLIIKDYPSVMQCKADATNTRAILEEQIKEMEVWSVDGAAGTSHNGHPLRNYSLLTHYFGVLEWKVFARFFHKILLYLEQECDEAIKKFILPINSDIPGGALDLDMPEPPYIHLPENHSDVSPKFAEVPGRLALDNRKYNITVAEVNRRIRAPECLNLSLLGALLRKGKTKENGQCLIEELSKNGINIPQGRRKEAPITVFTSLLEEESLILARDHRDVMNKHFPLYPFAKAINARSGCATPAAIDSRRQSLAAYRRLSSSILDYFSTSLFAVSERGHKATNQYAYLLHSYTRLTHGFGPDEAINFFDLFVKIADTAASLLPLTPSIP